MKIYHGSTVEIHTPQIIRSEKGRDFGEAFYTTPIKSQAERWAKRKLLIENRLGNKEAKAIVNVYEFDENNVQDINVCFFKEASEDWLNMVIQCRSNPGFKHNYDIVTGKIADDSVGETVSFVMHGIMRKEDAIEKLKFQKINSQMAFCSEKSLAKLKHVNSYEVRQ